MARKKAPTIYDVAKAAGVSHQTVTRYLHGFEGIRPATRERVDVAITELGYRPNAAARTLRSQRSNRIGILADRIDDNGPVRILNAASEYARSRGYVVDIAVSDGSNSGEVASSLGVLTEHQVAGILATAQTEIVLEQLRQLKFDGPLILAPTHGGDGEGATVNEVAGALAAEHLLSQGHRRIGYVAGPELWLAARGRAAGFARAVADAGATLVWKRHGDWAPGSGYEIWQSLSDEERDVTAIGIANDRMAIGVMAAAVDAGVDVPGELSLVGTDDTAESRYLRPALSTVEMHFEAEGRDLMAALIAKIEGASDAAMSQAIMPKLVVRDSTRTVRS